MFKTENEKLKSFLILAIVQMVFACAVFGNELMSINNRFVGGNFPIEHKYSWIRVSLFCAVAIISIMVAWFFLAKKPLSISFPPLKYVILFAVLSTVVGVLARYDSVTGWCCEVSPTRYFGFPFSYLMGSSPLRIFATFDLVRILKYNFFSYSFFLDVLFWLNVAFVFLSLLSFFMRTRRFAQQDKEQGLSRIV